jgi:type I site-specific restriction-modification system R (restriction) subunit
LNITESTLEQTALQWLKDLGYEVLFGPDISPEGKAERFFAPTNPLPTLQEREDYKDVVLTGRLRKSLRAINPDIPDEAIEDAVRKITRTDIVGAYCSTPLLVENNRRFHRMLTDGIPVEYRRKPSPRPSSAGRGRSESEGEGFGAKPELEVLLKGVFDKKRLLDLILNFVVFEDDGAQVVKKVAAYHQYHAVNKAVNSTISACGIETEPDLLFGRFPAHEEGNPFAVKEEQVPYGRDTKQFGDRRIGVIWHTQGSGKSLLMVFYAGKIIRHPAMKNPTLLVITDRNDLDDQLFGTFSGCKDLLRQTPVQAESRGHIKELLKVVSGGVIFTTIQKFLPDIKGGSYPVLSERENIVVIAKVFYPEKLHTAISFFSYPLLPDLLHPMSFLQNPVQSSMPLQHPQKKT